jgi:hypothetical protein
VEIDKVSIELRHTIHETDLSGEFRQQLPDQGMNKQEMINLIEQYSQMGSLSLLHLQS